mgnify:CR=1 FL=1
MAVGMVFIGRLFRQLKADEGHDGAGGIRQIVQSIGGFTGASPLAWNTIIDYGKKILTVVNESTTETQVEVGILDDVEIPEVFVYEDANFSINGNGKVLSGTIDFTDNVGTISNVVLTSGTTFVMTNVTEGCVKLGEGVIITEPVKVILPDNQTVLLTDTVGFVRKLPHDLVQAFRATLEEAKLADVLVNYSTKVKKGDRVAISAEDAALPFIKAVARAAVKAGAKVDYFVDMPDVDAEILKNGTEEQYARENIRFGACAKSDVWISAWGSENTKTMQSVDGEKLKQKRLANRENRKIY